MKKSLSIFICALLTLVAIFLVSCGDTDTDTTTNTNTDTSSDVATDTSTNTDTSTDTDEEGPTEFSITFVLDNGERNVSFVLKRGEIIQPRQVPNDPVREGYSFEGWYSGTSLWVPQPIKDNMLIKAKWKANNNSVIFDANGGEGSMDLLSIATDEKDNLPRNKFTYPGHTFLGWSTTPDGKVEYKDRATYYMGTNKVNTLYAVWSSKEYTITYDLQGGTQNSNNPDVYAASEDITFLAPSKTGYDFVGWKCDGEFIESTANRLGNIKLTAVWELERHTITYIGVEADEHTNPVDFNVEDEFLFTDAERAGHNFLGWYTDKTYTKPFTGIELNTANDVKVYAKFELLSYSISYKFEESGVTNHVKNITSYDVNTSFTFQDPTFNKAGYEFDGWYIENTNTTISELVPGENTGNITLVGKLKLIEYKIIYSNDLGITMPAGTKTTYTVKDAAATINIPNISKWGYTFNGWYKEENYMTKVSTITIDPNNPKDIFVYARFTLNTYSITYVLGNKPNVTNPNPDTYDIFNNFTFEEAISGEYKTLGWYLDANFTRKIESTDGKAENLTVYAKWASSDNLPTILLPANKIDSIYAEGSGARDSVVYNLVDGDKNTTGIYSAGNDWYGAVGDKVTIEFTEELDVYLAYAYVSGNWTSSQYTFYNANGVAVHTATGLGDENAGEAEEAEQEKLYESATPIKVKKIVIEITSIKWGSATTHKVSEVEVYIANPNYTPE